VLGVSNAYFYDVINDEVRGQSPGQLYAIKQAPEIYESDPDPLAHQESIEPIRNQYQITEKFACCGLFEFVNSFAKAYSKKDNGRFDSRPFGCSSF
jgi:hypothetical protein